MWVLVSEPGFFRLWPISLKSNSFTRNEAQEQHGLLNTIIDYIVPDQPADNAGLLVGDSFISIEGENVESWYEAVAQIEKYPNKTINISFYRQGEIYNEQVVWCNAVKSVHVRTQYISSGAI